MDELTIDELILFGGGGGGGGYWSAPGSTARSAGWKDVFSLLKTEGRKKEAHDRPHTAEDER